jgi:cell fate regulator YaaT (PSP1 superfamily)
MANPMSAGAPGAFVAVKGIPGGWIRAAMSCDADPPLADGDLVVVQADSGPVVAVVLTRPAALAARHAPTEPAMRVLRRASSQDQSLRARHEHREREAFRLCVMKIRERGLAMKLARVEQLFDGSRLVFFFTSEERVDFRELVRELASEFKTRIELRQIGVRDEARMLSGYGTCGRPLCCSIWLKSFEPVSIRMAKQQDLALNPSRLSGLCGRLKCCLRYELNHGTASAARGDAHPGSGGESPAHPGGCGGCGCGAGGCR